MILHRVDDKIHALSMLKRQYMNKNVKIIEANHWHLSGKCTKNSHTFELSLVRTTRDRMGSTEIMEERKSKNGLVILSEDLADDPSHLSAVTDSDANSLADSITNLTNLDNISAHNLYLGAELKKLGTLSGSPLAEVDSDVEDDLTSCGSSRPASVVNGADSTNMIDYSALDRFGFIVLGDRDMVHDKDTEEDKEFHRKQYIFQFYFGEVYVL